MRIALSGSSGLIGRRLKARLVADGHEILPLSQAALYGPVEVLTTQLQTTEVIIHLAGAPIFSRWTPKGKMRIMESRVIPTTHLVQAINKMSQPPPLFISASAIGIYSSRQSQTEQDHEYATDFPAEVCKAWEAATEGVNVACRKVIFRFGIVLDAHGGALQRMLPAFRLGFGGPIASGTQYFSWVHIDDVVAAVQFAMNQPLQGTYNLCAPETTTNKAFSKQLASSLSRCSWFNIPGFALRLLFGKSASMLISGQQVVPEKLLNAGFRFEYPGLNEALNALVRASL